MRKLTKMRVILIAVMAMLCALCFFTACGAAGEGPMKSWFAATLSEKIIYTAYLALETTKFDEAVAAVESLIAESGGYIEITEEEYQTLLPEYADKFGFEDAETFSYVCRPGSIASEMLYDKTVEALK